MSNQQQARLSYKLQAELKDMTTLLDTASYKHQAQQPCSLKLVAEVVRGGGVVVLEVGVEPTTYRL